MHPKFLLDENVSEILWQAIQTFNKFAVVPINATRVGDSNDLQKGVLDSELLLWAETNGRILVTHDKRTMPEHLAHHLAANHHLPGLFLLSYQMSVEEALELLAVAAQSENPLEWQDLIEFLG